MKAFLICLLGKLLISEVEDMQEKGTNLNRISTFLYESYAQNSGIKRKIDIFIEYVYIDILL